MKQLFLFIALFCYLNSHAQSPTEVTPSMLKKMRLEIENDVAKLKKKLQADNENEAIIEFTIDTFRIERMMGKYIDIDYSTTGMREAGYNAANAYDSLLNKYYKKILEILKGEDKKVLIQAQKSWLAFRDSEAKLIAAKSKDEYSGGGTIQLLIISSEYLDLIKTRVLQIYSYYTIANQIN